MKFNKFLNTPLRVKHLLLILFIALCLIIFKNELASILYPNQPAFWEDVYLVENPDKPEFKQIGVTDSIADCLAEINTLHNKDKKFACYYGRIGYLGLTPIYRGRLSP
jgi:hypothetical protein